MCSFFFQTLDGAPIILIYLLHFRSAEFLTNMSTLKLCLTIRTNNMDIDISKFFILSSKEELIVDVGILNRFSSITLLTY